MSHASKVRTAPKAETLRRTAPKAKTPRRGKADIAAAVVELEGLYRAAVEADASETRHLRAMDAAHAEKYRCFEEVERANAELAGFLINGLDEAEMEELLGDDMRWFDPIKPLVVRVADGKILCLIRDGDRDVPSNRAQLFDWTRLVAIDLPATGGGR